MSTYWRGALLDERSAAMMSEVAQLVPPGTILRPTQGSWSGGVEASAGTHAGCGAIDLAGQDAGMSDAMRNAIRDCMRQVGWAAWVRTPAQSDWPYHVHGIAVQSGGKGDRGCLSSGAHDQIIDYYENRNGLASGAPDDGPRTWVGVTWESYQPSEDDDMTPDQDKILRDTYNRSEWNHQDLIWLKDAVVDLQNRNEALQTQVNNVDAHANSAMVYSQTAMNEARTNRDEYLIPTAEAVADG